MGYRLEISELKDLNVGTKLFGYVEDVEKLRSHKWLLEHNYITGEEYWGYGFNPEIILSSEEFKEFIKLYIEDLKEFSGYHISDLYYKQLSNLLDNDTYKLLEWY